MNYAKTAEPIEMPFGLWTLVGPRKQVVGPDPPCEGAVIRVKDMPGHTRRHCHDLCKHDWTSRFAIWVVDLGASKEAQVQLCSPGGANVSSCEGTLAPSGEYDWTVRL